MSRHTVLLVALAGCIVIGLLFGVPALAGTGADDPDPPAVPPSYYGEVVIDGEPAPEGTVVDVVVDGDVSGSITVDEAGQYGSPEAGEEKLVAEDGSEGDEVTFVVDGDEFDRTVVNRTDPETVSWSPEDVTRVDLRTSVDAELFDVEIIDVPDSVEAGEDIDTLVRVTNDGAGPGVQTVSFAIDGEERAQEANVSLDVGAHRTFGVAVPTDAGDTEGDTVELAVATEDETVTTDVSVEEPGEFAVDLDVDDGSLRSGEYVAGDLLTGNVTVENVGERSDTQEVTVVVEDEVVTTSDVTLGEGETTTVEFQYETDRGDVGPIEITAEAEDDDATETVTVRSPATFDLDVIEDESRLDVVAGQRAGVLVEVTNVGELEGSDDVEIGWGDEETTERAVSLTSGEREDVIAEFDTDGLDPDGTAHIPVTVSSDLALTDDSVNLTVEEPDDAYFDVTIDEATGGNESEVVEVNGSVENIGGQDAEQDVEFLIDGAVNHTISVPLDGTAGSGEEWEFNETLPTDVGDAPSVSVAVRSENETATETVDLDALPEFSVSIVDVDDEIVENEPFDVEMDVRNEGDLAADANLTLEFNHTQVNQTTDSLEGLGGGDNETITLTVPASGTEGEEGERLVSAIVGENETAEIDDTSRTRVTVGEDADFEIESLTLEQDGQNVAAGDIVAGSAIDVEVSVHNDGDVADTQLVEVELDGDTVHTEDVTLDEGESHQIDVTVETGSDNVGDAAVSASSDDDRENASVTVNERATFELVDVGVDVDGSTDDFVRGEEGIVSVEIENTGGWEGEDSVRFYVDGSRIGSSDDVELDAGENETVDFTYTPDSTDDLEMLIFTDDDYETETRSVLEPAALALDVRSITDPVTAGEDLTVFVSASNSGEAPVVDETVRLVLDGVEDTETISLDGGESERFNLSTEIDESATPGPLTVDVVGDDSVTATTEIIEPPTDPDFRVSNLDANGSAIQFDGKNVTVSADVTNIGDLEGTQTIEFSVDGDEVAEIPDLELDSGESEPVEFNLTVDEYETGTVTYEVASENRSATDTIDLLEPAPGEIAVTAIDVDESVTQDGSLDATVMVRNVGDLPASGTVELEYAPGEAVDSTVRDEEPVSDLAAGDAVDIDLSVEPPAEPRAGNAERDVRISVGEEEITESVTVDFEGVRSGVEAAEALQHDVVSVGPGTYDHRSTIVIEQAGLTLEAADPADRPTIEAPYGSDETTVEILADDVRTDGIVFEGDGNGTAIAVDANGVELVDVIANGFETGIETVGGEETEIRRTGVEDATTGIRLGGDGNAEIAHTTVADAGTGISLASNESLVRVTTVEESDVGLSVTGWDNRVERSFIRDNEVGVGPVVPGGAIGTADFVVVTESNLERNQVSLDLAVDGDGNRDPEIHEINATSNWWGEDDAPNPGIDYLEVNPTVNADDYLDSRTIPGEFVIDDETIPSEVVRGDELVVSTTIENVGGTEGEPDVLLVEDGDILVDDDGRVIESPGEIDPGETADVTLSYETSVTDEPDIDLRLQTEDDYVDRTVDVLGPAVFDVTIVGTDDPVDAGSAVSVDVEVENTGEAEVTQTIEFEIDGETRTTEAVTLGENDVWADTVGVPTESGDEPEATLTVRSDDDEETRTIDVNEPVEPEPDPDPDPDPTPTRIDPDHLPVPDPISTPPAGVDVQSEETLEIDVDETTDTAGVVSEATRVREIVFDTATISGDVTVRDISHEPEETGAAPGRTASVSQISVPAEVANQSATIQMGIETDVLEAEGIESADLVVHRFTDGDWHRIETTVVDETDDEVLIEAETPGFSMFAVSAVSEPEATFTSEPTNPEPGMQVTLDGSESSDEYGDIETYEWTIDGETVDGEQTTVEFDDPGEYQVSLTVTNDAGESDTAAETVEVAEPPADDDVVDDDVVDDDVVDDDEPVELPGIVGQWELGILLVVLAILTGALWYVRNRSEEDR